MEHTFAALHLSGNAVIGTQHVFLFISGQSLRRKKTAAASLPFPFFGERDASSCLRSASTSYLLVDGRTDETSIDRQWHQLR